MLMARRLQLSPHKMKTFSSTYALSVTDEAYLSAITMITAVLHLPPLVELRYDHRPCMHRHPESHTAMRMKVGLVN